MYYCQYSKPLKLPITHMSNLLNSKWISKKKKRKGSNCK